MNPTDPVDIVIREACLDDKSALAEFIQPFVDDKKILPRTPDELDMLAKNGFIAEMAGCIVGFAALEIYSPKLAEIRSLTVSAAVQGRGVGKRLVEACVNRARARNILEVMAVSSAEVFFHACGFDFTLPDEKKAFFLKTRET